MNKPKDWTEEELEKLRDFYPTASMGKILEIFPNRTRSAIIAKASKLKIRKTTSIWYEDEITLMKQHYPSDTNNSDLLKLIPRHSFVAIKTRAKKLGLKRGEYREYKTNDDGPCRKWTVEEIDILKNYYNTISDKELLELLPGRTIMGIKHFVKKINLGAKEIKAKPFSGEPWTMAEEKFLIENFSKLPNIELMEFLSSRTLVAIKAQAQKLRLKRDKNTWGAARAFQPWKQCEIELLAKNWGKKTLEELSNMLNNRSPKGVKNQAQKMYIAETCLSFY